MSLESIMVGLDDCTGEAIEAYRLASMDFAQELQAAMEEMEYSVDHLAECAGMDADRLEVILQGDGDVDVSLSEIIVLFTILERGVKLLIEKPQLH